MSHQIDITENGTTTLATEGKYCDRNIDVNVNVASSGGSEVEDGLISGTLSGAYRNDRVTTVGQYGLACTNLTSIDLPNVTNLDSYAIFNCTRLKTANVPSATSISNAGFANCYVLKTVILGGTTVVTLKNTNVFDSCFHIKGKVHATYNPQGLADGFIFVPDNLLDDYRQATNWSTLADRIKPLSELEE